MPFADLEFVPSYASDSLTTDNVLKNIRLPPTVRFMLGGTQPEGSTGSIRTTGTIAKIGNRMF